MQHWSESLKKLNACGDAVVWASKQPSLSVAWKKCQRGDWMLWLLGRLEKSNTWSKERRLLVACCAECAATTLKYCNADTITATIWCLDACDRWARGETDREEVEAARSAAAYAADAAVNSAAYAAYAAAAYAADAAAYAADANAARGKALADSAKIVRRHFPQAPRLGVSP
jgi:hypothetical protein